MPAPAIASHSDLQLPIWRHCSQASTARVGTRISPLTRVSAASAATSPAAHHRFVRASHIEPKASGQEQRLGVADVEEVRGREDEEERRRPRPMRLARGRRRRGGRAAAPRTARRRSQTMKAATTGSRSTTVTRPSEPREEREEDDVQVEVAGEVLRVAGVARGCPDRWRHVAPDRDVGVVRRVPAVPRLEEVGDGPVHDPQRKHADRQDGDLRGQRPGDEEARCGRGGGRASARVYGRRRVRRVRPVHVGPVIPARCYDGRPPVGAWRSR